MGDQLLVLGNDSGIEQPSRVGELELIAPSFRMTLHQPLALELVQELRYVAFGHDQAPGKLPLGDPPGRPHLRYDVELSRAELPCAQLVAQAPAFFVHASRHAEPQSDRASPISGTRLLRPFLRSSRLIRNGSILGLV